MYESFLTANYSAKDKSRSVEALEMKANVIAAYVASKRTDEVDAAMEKLKCAPRHSFELAFNSACAHIVEKEWDSAEEHLELALRVARDNYELEDLTEEEIDEELAPGNIQLAYVLHCKGQSSKGIELLTNVLRAKPADAASMAIGTNNLIAARGARELFDSLKRFEKVVEKAGRHDLQLSKSLAQKLNQRQQHAIWLNTCLLYLHSNKHELCRGALKIFRSHYENSLWAACVEASLLLKEKKSAGTCHCIRMSKL